MTITDLDRVAFEQAWEQWHRDHEAALADPHGFLAITALHWLTGDPQRFDDAPGTWSTGEDGVTVVLDESELLLLDGEPLRGRHCFGIIAERGGVNPVYGDAVIEVAKRGGHDIVRPRHPRHGLRVHFRGTPAYPPLERWVVAGRFCRFDVPKDVTVGATVEGLHHVYESPGQVEIALQGETFRLTVFNGRQPGSLMVLFTDATSGLTTYAANRVLALDPPDSEGIVTVDFNRATNLPCAYTDFATCPLPPAENRLPLAIEAGEKTPLDRR